MTTKRQMLFSELKQQAEDRQFYRATGRNAKRQKVKDAVIEEMAEYEDDENAPEGLGLARWRSGDDDPADKFNFAGLDRKKSQA